MATPLKKSGLNQAVRDNLALGPHKRPWQELADQFNVKLTSVYRRVAEQRAKQRITAKAAGSANLGVKMGSPHMLGKIFDPGASLEASEAILEGVVSSTVLTRDERLKALSDIAQTAPDAVKVAAIAKLEEFERAAGSQFGPPPPTTDEAVVSYLCDIFDGIDLRLINEAIQRVSAQPAETQEISPSSDNLGGRAD